MKVRARRLAFTRGAANSDKTGGSREKVTAWPLAGKCSTGAVAFDGHNGVVMQRHDYTHIQARAHAPGL